MNKVFSGDEPCCAPGGGGHGGYPAPPPFNPEHELWQSEDAAYSFCSCGFVVAYDASAIPGTINPHWEADRAIFYEHLKAVA